MKIERPAAEIGFVTTLKHQRDPEIKTRYLKDKHGCLCCYDKLSF